MFYLGMREIIQKRRTSVGQMTTTRWMSKNLGKTLDYQHQKIITSKSNILNSKVGRRIFCMTMQ